jgi:hypothetical protein
MNNFTYTKLLEAIGIAGIIASLVFVGTEIRQNSAIARAEAQRSISETEIGLMMATATNPELASLVTATLFSNEIEENELTGGQETILFSYTIARLFSWESIYDGVQLGVLPQSELDDFQASAIDNDFTRARWPFLRTILNQDFASFLESLDWYRP